MPEYRKVHLQNPYFLCAVSVMTDSTRFAHYDFGDRPVEFVFDQKIKHQQWINQAYDQVLRTKWGHLCAAKSMADRRMVSPLQVADLVAYESKKYIEERLQNGDASDLRWPMLQLRELFYGSETTLYNWHGLLLVSDFWGNYQRLCDHLKVPTRETYAERKRRIQEIRQNDARLAPSPHDEIKAKLEAEKAERKKRKAKKPSASGRVSGDKD